MSAQPVRKQAATCPYDFTWARRVRHAFRLLVVLALLVPRSELVSTARRCSPVALTAVALLVWWLTPGITVTVAANPARPARRATASRVRWSITTSS